MNPNAVTLLTSLMGTAISLDANGNYVSVAAGGAQTVVSPSDVLEAIAALRAFADQTLQSLQNGASAATLASFLMGIQPF